MNPSATMKKIKQKKKERKQRPAGFHRVSLLLLPFLSSSFSVFFFRLRAKCVVHSAAYCPEDMKFHDNSKHSINCRALVQSGMTR